ncbi:L-seryl-tRNA(Sec) selenium transferase [bacterium]|nr:L-seryl-tRNA(Sec) selenium transferase [bacterium]
MSGSQVLFRELPKVDRLLERPEIQALLVSFPREQVVTIARLVLDEKRELIQQGELKAVCIEDITDEIVQGITAKFNPSLRFCINGAGIVLHTNMGRAPLSPVAQTALQDVARNYSNLEIDLETGKRGIRYQHVEALLCELTGAEAAMVVNNNAAATFLVINTLASDKECMVSRGELITIGDSFRLPAIMAQAGAQMVDVGTTNQTYLSDFEAAMTENTALLARIHRSNFTISGFTSEPELNELAELAHAAGFLLYHDVGSGALFDLSQYGLPKEPVIRESLAAGADVVSFSGDKLIGGPQAGIIVGRQNLIQKMKKNQLTRALRAGKLTYAALEATLRLFLDEKKLVENHAVMKMLLRPEAEIKKQAEAVVKGIVSTDLRLSVISGHSEVGGGSLATESLPTWLLTVEKTGMAPDLLALRLRQNDPPIVCRIHNNQVCLDFRTIHSAETALVISALEQLKGDA